MGAVQFIENMDRTSLTISDDEFEKSVEAAVSAIAERNQAMSPTIRQQATFSEKPLQPGLSPRPHTRRPPRSHSPPFGARRAPSGGAQSERTRRVFERTSMVIVPRTRAPCEADGASST